MIKASSFPSTLPILTMAKRRVSVETKLIWLFLISISAPFNSNLGLLVSVAGVILRSDSIKILESISILGLPSFVGNCGYL